MPAGSCKEAWAVQQRQHLGGVGEQNDDGAAVQVDGWVYDEANSTFIDDPDMAKRLMDSNPNSFRSGPPHSCYSCCARLWWA